MSFGPIITESDALPAQGAPTDTGTGFFTGAVGATPPTSAQTINRMDEFEGAFTDRSVVATQPLYDAVDAFFAEGGSTAIIGAYAAGNGGGGSYEDGLSLLDDDRLGPGQISLIGTELTSTVITDVTTFCEDNNRIGILDVGTGDTVAAMQTKGDLMPAMSENLGMFGSWVTIPAASGTVGAGPRTIPASSVIMGLCNRVDLDGNPNRAAGGRDYPLQYVTAIELDPVAADRVALWSHGVNMFMNDFGVLENYGFQTNVPQSVDTPFWQLNCARARMWMKAQAKSIASPYYMRTIDGQGKLAARLTSDLDTMLNTLWAADGLYGATAADAYQVIDLTTDTDVTNGRLHIACKAKLSLYAKAILIDLVNVPLLGSF